MTPPTWVDAPGRRRPTLACWTFGREVAPMRYRATDLRPHGWEPGGTLQIPSWCGLFYRVRADTHRRRVVGPRPDLGARRHAEPTAPVAATRTVLGA